MKIARASSRSRVLLHPVLLVTLLLSLPSLMLRSVLFAQGSGPVQRIVSGKVSDKENQPVRNAVVYLKDDRTLSVKSFISDDGGGYRFGQLAQNTDYELWAEADGKKSAVKTISSFESKNAITINLRIDK